MVIVQIWNAGPIAENPLYFDVHHNIQHALSDVFDPVQLDVFWKGEGAESDGSDNDAGGDNNVRSQAAAGVHPPPAATKKKAPSKAKDPWNGHIIQPPPEEFMCTRCRDCSETRQVVDDLRAGLRSAMSALDTPPPDSEQWLPRADACGLKLARLYSHMLRCNVQAYALKRLERQVEEDPHHVHIVVDFKVCSPPPLPCTVLVCEIL